MTAGDLFEGQVEVDLSECENRSGQAAAIVCGKLERIAAGFGYFIPVGGWAFSATAKEDPDGHRYNIYFITTRGISYPIMGSSLRGESLFLYNTKKQHLEVAQFDYLDKHYL